ncbi:P2Y purinoceptor 14-like [Clinocottus analis]|uniref:P2Y purinoceptor 14-like n=1 Tax=Clinocottus analis TaxID=304258 RepID=UPI0035C2084D
MRDYAAQEVTSSFNQSSVTNQTTCAQVDGSADLFFMVFHSLVFLVGLPLNGFIVNFYFCRAQQKTSSSITVYLKNLAAADFLLCLCLPIRIAKFASSSVAVHSLHCNAGRVVLFLNVYASILFMSYIAANRYLKVVRPSGTHVLQTVRAAHVISTATWVFLLAATSIFAVLSFLTQKPITSVLARCDDSHSGRFSLPLQVVRTVSTAAFLLVLVSVLFFYCRTARRVSLAQRRRPASSGCTELGKSRRNMSVLVGVFCFCFVPYHLVGIPEVFLSCSNGKFLYYVTEVTIMMSVLNVCLDPLIYFILCRKFRAQFRRFGK